MDVAMPLVLENIRSVHHRACPLQIEEDGLDHSQSIGAGQVAFTSP